MPKVVINDIDEILKFVRMPIKYNGNLYVVRPLGNVFLVRNSNGSFIPPESMDDNLKKTLLDLYEKKVKDYKALYEWALMEFIEEIKRLHRNYDIPMTTIRVYHTNIDRNYGPLKRREFEFLIPHVEIIYTIKNQYIHYKAKITLTIDRFTNRVHAYTDSDVRHYESLTNTYLIKFIKNTLQNTIREQKSNYLWESSWKRKETRINEFVKKYIEPIIGDRYTIEKNYYNDYMVKDRDSRNIAQITFVIDDRTGKVRMNTFSMYHKMDYYIMLKLWRKLRK